MNNSYLLISLSLAVAPVFLEEDLCTYSQEWFNTACFQWTAVRGVSNFHCDMLAESLWAKGFCLAGFQTMTAFKNIIISVPKAKCHFSFVFLNSADHKLLYNDFLGPIVLLLLDMYFYSVLVFPKSASGPTLCQIGRL